jgi:phage shock protein PspC (stress-responsive transcriptional regulator)/predicted membrane protein
MNESTTEQLPPAPPPPEPRRLVRSRDDRVLGGVCGGLGRYFNIDPTIFRIGAVVVAFVAGAGLLAYAAAWVLVPSEDSDSDAPATRGGWLGAVIVIAALFIGLPVVVAMTFAFGAILVPVALIVAVSLLVWWLVSGESPSGNAGEIAKRAVFGMIVLVFCGLIAFAGAWAAAAGGETVVAIAVIAAGVAIVAGAFARPVRWLILPTVILALSAGSVAAAGVDLDGGIGDRTYRPTSVADLQDRYELGAGKLTLDLQGLDLPAGDRTVEIDVGLGDTLVILPDSKLCAGLDATVGIGEARLYTESNSGVDVDFREVPDASPTTSRILISADVGVGQVRVEGSGWGGGRFDANRRCIQEGERASR